MECGGLCVMITGIPRMLQSCVDNLDIMAVSTIYCIFSLASIPLRTHPVLYNGSLFYHLDNLHCNGSELILSDCIHNGVGVHDCLERLEEAGVICNSKFHVPQFIIENISLQI